MKTYPTPRSRDILNVGSANSSRISFSRCVPLIPVAAFLRLGVGEVRLPDVVFDLCAISSAPITYTLTSISPQVGAGGRVGRTRPDTGVRVLCRTYVAWSCRNIMTAIENAWEYVAVFSVRRDIHSTTQNPLTHSIGGVI
jgi:hypothetical protein